MKLLSVAVVTLAAASAFAAKSNTEFYYQPAAGQSAVTATYEMGSKPAKTKSGATESDSKTSTSDIALHYAYGLNDTMAVGAYTFFGTEKTDDGTNTQNASGMGDLHAFFQGYSDMFHYGANLGINTEKAKYDTTTNLKSNRSSGGLSLGANVGVLMSADAWNYGADLAYMMPFERSTDYTPDLTISGGNTLMLTPFGEYNYGMGFVGGQLTYSSMGEVKTKQSSVETTVDKGENFLALSVYGSYDINDMATGLARITMAPHSERDLTSSTKVKAYTETMFELGARFTF